MCRRVLCCSGSKAAPAPFFFRQYLLIVAVGCSALEVVETRLFVRAKDSSVSVQRPVSGIKSVSDADSGPHGTECVAQR